MRRHLYRQFLRPAIVLLSTYYAYMLEYRAELLLWVLTGLLPFILMGAWMQAAAVSNLGFTPLDFARYFLASFIARQFVIVWVIWEFEREIVEGRLSPRLLQPLDPAWHHVATHVAERLARLPFVVGLIGLFFLLYPDAFWIPSWSGALFFSVAVVMAFGLRFIMQYTLAMFAFWTERAAALEDLWFLLYIFLSGLIAPLELFPPQLQQIIVWTPFPYMIHFPAALLVGMPVNPWQGFGVMVFWGALFFLANRWLWRRGLKRYSGMGA